MDVYFNDLTLTRDESRDCVLLREFAGVWAALSKASGVSHVRCDDSSYVEVMAIVNHMPRSAVSSLLRSALRRPYESDETLPQARDVYYGSEFHCDDGNGASKECRALGWAVSSGSLAVGVCSSAYWESLSISVCVTYLDAPPKRIDALCVTKLSHLRDVRVSAWCEKIRVPIPVPTLIPPSEKKISIAGDHHGQDVMKNFADRLRHSEYVLEVMSAEYQSSNSSPFVNKIFDDGRIRLCLYWEDIHYQLIVKTTSVNAAQSDYIAGHLSTRFDLGWRKR